MRKPTACPMIAWHSNPYVSFTLTRGQGYAHRQAFTDVPSEQQSTVPGIPAFQRAPLKSSERPEDEADARARPAQFVT